MAKSKKNWYTVAYFTAEGKPHSAHWNFVHVRMELEILRRDLEHEMSMDYIRRGAHAAAVWPGRLAEWDALHSDIKPLFYIHEDGTVSET